MTRMRSGPLLDDVVASITAICRAGLPPDALRDRVLARVRRAVPFDAAFWTTVDPATLLFTQPHQEEIPPDTVPYFLRNEFIDEDVNKFTSLARDRRGVRTLVQETAGDVGTSARYRDIFEPLGLGDELRAAFRSGGTCWGFVCLHRERGAPFSAREVEHVRRLSPILAAGIRAGLLVGAAELGARADAPGLLVVRPDGSLVSATEAGQLWLEELGPGVPIEVQALAAGVSSANAMPRLRVRTRAGRWAVLHASRLQAPEGDAIAIIIEEPSRAELAPVLMMAYGLTRQEQVLTGLVCRGLSTGEIVDELHITANTVQDHLKAIFEKTGVGSRRELVATILQDQYLPRAMAGERLAPSGFFRA